MNKNLKLILAAAVATTFAASAHNPTNALVDSQGKAVKGDFGQCIESEYNTNSAECGVVTHEMGFSVAANTLFGFDSATLRAEGKAELSSMASKIIEAANLGEIKTVTGIKVVGHTDSTGKAAYNQKLSERRALSVAQFLVAQGINPELISAYGEGASNPVASNATKAGRQQNRRVDVGVQGVAVEK